MKTNFKIVLSICTAFIIGFGALYLAITIDVLNSAERLDYKKEFFTSQTILNEEKILLLGSSHLGHIDMTYVINTVSTKNSNYIIYNLADTGDTPKFRYDNLQRIIELEPRIIFYGVSYRDFHQPLEPTNSESESFDIKKQIEKKIPHEISSINPQLLTRETIRTILDYTGIQEKPTYEIYQPNTPFFPLGDLQTKILNKNELERQMLVILPSPSEIQIHHEDNAQFEKFKEIIQKLQDEEITVIVFITPLHRLYLDQISEPSQESFAHILNNVSEQYGIRIYDFEERYADLDIWNSVDHTAYNDRAMIFSDEIAEMILQEIKP